MLPTLLSIIQPIFNLVKGNTKTRIVLLKNNTIVLLESAQENYKDRIESFKNLSQDNLVSPNIHFYRNFNTFLFVNPLQDDVGLLYIVDKKEPINLQLFKERAFENFKKDCENSEVIVDSAIHNLTDYQPVMYLFVNNDLKMGKGKACGQCGHAVGLLVEELMGSPDQAFVDWKESTMKKVVLKVESEQALIKLRDDAVRSSLKNSLIKDAGLTEIPAGSITALAIGPDEESKIDKITKNLNAL